MGISMKSINTRNEINIILFTKYKLIRNQLNLLLETKSEIKIQDSVSTSKELLEKISLKKPDVVLFCIMDDEIDNIDVLPEVFKLSPETQAVVLSNQNGKLDQTKVLKLGATGIVSADQKVEVLIRAIRQVSEGEVCLNQKLMAQLLGNNSKEDENNGANGNSNLYGVHKSDSLTNRELEVIEVIGHGLTNKEISKKLYISEATVRHHLSSIYSKVNVGDRLNLVIYAYQHEIVSCVER